MPESAALSRLAFPLLVGLSVPMIFFGRSVMAVVLLAAFAKFLASDLRATAWVHFRRKLIMVLGLSISGTVGLWTISAVGSLDPFRSLEAVWRTGIFVGMGVLFYEALKLDNEFRWVAVRSLVIATAATTFLGLLAEIGWPQLFWGLRFKGWLSTELVNELKAFSSLVVVLLPILLWSIFAERNRSLYQFLAIFGAIGTCMLVLESHNRAAIAGMLGMSIALMVCWAARPRTRKYVLLIGALTAFVFIIVIAWLKISRGNWGGSTPDYDWFFPVWLIDFQRQIIWCYSLDIARSAPWFGIGANTINFVSGANAPMPGNESLNILPSHPHNWIVEVIAETGGVGFIALLSIYVGLIYQFWSGFWRSGRAFYVVACAILAGYLVSGLFNFSYWSAWWQISTIIGLAIALSLPDLSEPSDLI